MDESRRCTGTSTRSGERCKKAALKGATVCATHGGSAPQVKAAAKRRELERKANAEAQRMVAKAGVEQDPIEHLLDSLYLATALVQVWGEMVADIDAKAEEESEGERGFLRGELGYEEIESDKGFTDVVVMPKDRLMAVNSRGESQVHPYVQRYEAAIERRAKLAKLCLDAGVAERQVQITETQVAVAHEAFEAGLAAANMTDAQKQEARRAYANRLRRP
jgi:hypothetical protein